MRSLEKYVEPKQVAAPGLAADVALRDIPEQYRAAVYNVLIEVASPGELLVLEAVAIRAGLTWRCHNPACRGWVNAGSVCASCAGAKP